MTTPSNREKIAGMRASYKTRRQRREALAMLAITLVIVWSASWALMLTAGNAHLDWWPSVPAMGYGTAVVLVSWPLAILGVAMIAIETIREMRK